MARLSFLLVTLVLATAKVLLASGFVLVPPRQKRHQPCRKVSLSLSLSSNHHHDDDDAHHPQQQPQDTIDSLAKRLQTIILSSQSPEKKRQKLLHTRLSDMHLNRTYVGPSTIDNIGRGLFCSQEYDCPRGTLLTCYPGDALVLLSENKILWGDHVVKQQQVQNMTSIDQQYMLRAVSDEWGIVALPDLVVVGGDNNDPGAYLGHFANDGVQTPPRCEADLSLYVLESNDRANAMHRPLEDCHMVTVATRDIQKGEEIFVTYGPEYWMEQPSFGTRTCSTGGETTSSSSSTKRKRKRKSSTGKGFG